MKIGVVSDVHLEFGRGGLVIEKLPYLVLAGDVVVADLRTMSKGIRAMYQERYMNFFEECSKNCGNVIYIAGNHEFYHGDINEVHDHIRLLLDGFPNIHFLDNESKAFPNDGISFFGSTFWTDFKDFNPLIVQQCKDSMSDYYVIRNGDKTLMPMDVYEINQSARDCLFEYLESPLSQHKQIVVTHHAPSYASVERQYATDDLSYAYVNTGLDKMLLDGNGPNVWIHVHIHAQNDYMHGNTRVISNPRGYVGRESGAEQRQLKIIEV